MHLATRHRPGFSFIDVALATVIVAIGTLFAGQFIRATYDLLDPRGSVGGLRRYWMAQELLQAQAEALRVLRVIPNDAGRCRLVTPPAGSGFTISVTQTQMGASPQLMLFDIQVSHSGKVLGRLQMTTLRDPADATRGVDAKIGL